MQTILSTIVSHLNNNAYLERVESLRVRQITATVCRIQQIVRALHKLNADDQEFAYLKTIALFGAGKAGSSFLNTKSLPELIFDPDPSGCVLQIMLIRRLQGRS